MDARHAGGGDPPPRVGRVMGAHSGSGDPAGVHTRRLPLRRAERDAQCRRTAADQPVELGGERQLRGIVQDGFGSADALRLRDVEPPVPGAGEVLIRVRAAGCGPDVWHLITGLPYFVRVVPQFRKLSRGVRGSDAAGTVEAVGSNVTEFNPGDELMGIVEGSFAELAVGRADKLVPKPERLTFEQAAAVPISGITAVQAIHDEGK